MPPWCRVVYESDAAVEFGVAATDALHDGEGWIDVRRAAGDHAELPEVVIELDDVVVSSRGGVWKGSEVVLGKPWSLINDNPDAQQELSVPMPTATATPRPGPRSTPPPTATVELPGTHGSILMRASAFGHWLLHRLPRLHSLSRTVAPPSILSVELPYDDQPFFDCFGFTPADVRRLGRDRQPSAQVERLVLTTHLAKPTSDRRIDSGRLAALVDDLEVRWSAALKHSRSPIDVYITRRDRRGERDGCQNRNDLEQFFADQGYTIVFPPDLSLPEQFALFRRARSVVGELGSGMHWAFACAPGTSITYLTPRSGVKAQPFDPNRKSWMRAIADARGLHFGQIVVSPQSSKQGWLADLERVGLAWSSRPETVAPHSVRIRP